MDSKIIWILAIVFGVAVFAKTPSDTTFNSAAEVANTVKPNGETDPDSHADQAPKREMNMGGDFAIQRSPDGHFYADGQVNGVAVRFLVDSGATAVALTAEDAARIGKHVGPGDMTIKVQTANGEVGVAPVTLDNVAVGSVTVSQVDGVIAGDGLSISLLGQSFLARINKVSIENDRLVLN